MNQHIPEMNKVLTDLDRSLIKCYWRSMKLIRRKELSRYLELSSNQEKKAERKTNESKNN